MSGRETIVTTLLTFLAAAAGVTAYSRHFVEYDEVSPSDYPYLILMQDREVVDPTFQQMGATQSIKRMYFKVLLYALGDGTENTVPATQMNNMMDAIEAALQPLGKPDQQTLGLPYVQWVTIDGHIEYDGSAYGNFGIMVIPIEVCFT